MVKAVILAAGRGSRLGNLTDDRPKCMVELWGKPLLHWQLEALRGAGIEDVTIVRGYMAEKINVPGVTYLENKRWAETNMVATLMEAGAILKNGPTVVSYSDIVYSSDAVNRLLAGVGDMRITFDPDWRALWEKRFKNPLSDAETFKLNSDGTILEIGQKTSKIDDIKGQYMGLLYYTPRAWDVFEKELLKTDSSSCDMTSMLNRILGEIKIHAVPIYDGWLEVDAVTDLQLFNKPVF